MKMKNTEYNQCFKTGDLVTLADYRGSGRFEHLLLKNQINNQYVYVKRESIGVIISMCSISKYSAEPKDWHYNYRVSVDDGIYIIDEKDLRPCIC